MFYPQGCEKAPRNTTSQAILMQLPQSSSDPLPDEATNFLQVQIDPNCLFSVIMLHVLIFLCFPATSFATGEMDQAAESLASSRHLDLLHRTVPPLRVWLDVRLEQNGHLSATCLHVSHFRFVFLCHQPKTKSSQRRTGNRPGLIQMAYSRGNTALNPPLLDVASAIRRLSSELAVSTVKTFSKFSKS